MHKIVWQRLKEPGVPMQEFITPMGRFPKDFRLWFGHTNFNLSKKRIKTIENVPGVESLDVFSPYRFRIGIGLAFDQTDVRLNIQKEFGVTHKEFVAYPEEITKKIGAVKDLITKENWAIYVTPNGEISYVESDNFKEISEKVGLYQESNDKIGGLLLKSWNAA